MDKKTQKKASSTKKASASKTSTKATNQNVPYAKSKKPSKKPLDIRKEIYTLPTPKLADNEDVSKRTFNSRTLNYNDGTGVVLISNKPTLEVSQL
ncbi:hypothetical protein [Fibrobacter sp. UWB12]|uniref:hypothetical protein n=1 Tax=Fibrobacter sp. UWB12 TaxID=1896203 RepID=UPI000915DE7F|nr:hypothetical protein [Fibrobacter sp. UWB12]SHK61087.1 hypothetical protein SAMN05720759_104178 [Fibrobacter sp. UWB12]